MFRLSHPSEPPVTLSPTSTTRSAAPSRRRSIASWTLRILLAAVFIAAGGAKLAGVPMMVDIFAQIGLGQGFRYLTGIFEVIGGLWLFVPGTTALAAMWLAATMVGAILAHLLVLPESAVPAAVLLALCLVLVWLHRDQLAGLKSRVG